MSVSDWQFASSFKQKLFWKHEQYWLSWVFLSWRAVWFYSFPLFSIIYSSFHELSVCNFSLPLLLIASALSLPIHILEPYFFCSPVFLLIEFTENFCCKDLATSVNKESYSNFYICSYSSCLANTSSLVLEWR